MSLRRIRCAGSRPGPLHDREAGEVDARERAEIQNRAVRDAVAHRLEQALELARAPARTGATIVSARWYGTAALRPHRANLSAKRAILSRSQKTSPR